MAGGLGCKIFPYALLLLCLSACNSGGDEAGVVLSSAEEVSADELIIEQPGETQTAGTDIKKISSSQNEISAPVTLLGVSFPLLATGSEPFWTAHFDGEWIAFDRPGLPLVEVPMPTFDPGEDKPELQAEDLLVKFAKSGCDVAAGQISTVIVYEGVEYEGCARTDEGEAGPFLQSGDTSWKALIASSQKALDACLQASGSQQLVYAIYPREPGVVGIITGDDVGQMTECGADLETGEVYFLDPISLADAKDMGAGMAVFSRCGKSPFCEGGEELDNRLGRFYPAGCNR